MVRQTSLEVYRQIKEEGLLSSMRMKVYEYVFKNGPCTSREAVVGLRIDSNSVMPRFKELEERGVIKEVGEAVCKVSGRNAILWEITNNLPSDVNEKQSKRPSKREISIALKEIRHALILRKKNYKKYKTSQELRTVYRWLKTKSV